MSFVSKKVPKYKNPMEPNRIHRVLQYLVESGKVIGIIRARHQHDLYLGVVKKEPSSVLQSHPFSA